MKYEKQYFFQENLGNNALSYNERQKILQKNPSLIIPARIFGDIEDVKNSENIVFEEVENNQIFSCKWLENFVTIKKPNLPEIVVFDNHNHALFFWCEAIKNGILEPNFELLHIDEHSDLWENDNEIEDFLDLQKIWNFTNFDCNVGNYILPAMRKKIVKNIIRIENEFQIDENLDYIPEKNSVLNLDLDIFSPDLAHIPREKFFKIIIHLITKVKFVTIATSPYFIDQNDAIKNLQKIFEMLENLQK